MAINDQARDRYNPPSTSNTDFEKFTFGELEIGELFWQSNVPGDNIPWRKDSLSQGKNLKAESLHNFSANTVVWQKT